MTTTNKTIGLIFLGPPGSGKGTQGLQLAENLQIPHISTGEILRNAIAAATALGQKAKAYMDRGELVPDELILDLIEERLQASDAQKGWILDGFPRNVPQAIFLDELLAKLHQDGEQVIYLQVPDQVLLERLLQRGRADDNETTIRRRLEVYKEQTSPLIDYYQKKGNLHAIDGDRSPAEVTQSLQALVNS